MSTEDKINLNDLLSRFDTLHDFCDPSPDTTRNKDQYINQKDKEGLSEEFANVFKPEILKALETETAVRDISKKELLKNINAIIDKYITVSLKPYYKTDVVNLIDRLKNGLILVNYLKTNGKDVFEKTDRLSNFESTVVALFEFLYNTVFQKEQGIGKFISNMQLPIFDYVNSEYKVLENGEYKKIQVNTEKGVYIPTTDIKMKTFIQTCTANKESIISFILGTINDSDTRDIFLSTEDTSGFYNFPSDGKSSLSIPKKKDRTDVDRKVLSELYFRYLKDLREILGQYFNKDASSMIYLIVDTTNISFSKYYKELSPVQRQDLKLMVLCNVAMSWDGATSPECQQKTSRTGEEEITHTKKDENRAIYDIDSLTLKDKSGSTVVKFDTGLEMDSKPVPRELGQLSECIRQQIDSHRTQTKECKNFKTKGRLLDIKRSGDALQALMAKKLNDRDINSSDLYVFVTLDHLAFLKARLNGIPSIFTSTMKEKKSSIRNRVLILFNNTFEKNYKAMAIQLEKEYNKITTIQKSIDDNFPLAYFDKLMKSEKEKEAYFRFYLMLDYIIRTLLGIVLYVRPKSQPKKLGEWLKTITYDTENFDITQFISDDNIDDTQDIIVSNLRVLLQDYIVHDKLKENAKFQYYNPYLNNCFYKKIEIKISDSVQTTITRLNGLVNTAKTELTSIAHSNGQSQLFTLSSDVGLLDSAKIQDILEQFILQTFIIECFYTIKRAGIFTQYFDDIKNIEIDIYGNMISDLVSILKKEPMDDQDSASKASNYIEAFKSMNKKYGLYTNLATTDESNVDFERGPIGILSKFFEEYTYTEDSDIKEKLKTLFELNFDEYTEFIDSLLGEVEIVFGGVMKSHINRYVVKFNSKDYFVDPVKATRTTLRVKEKMAECMDQFNLPSMLQRTYQDLIYSRIHNNAEGFYKSKMAELHLGNLTGKAISFKKAMAKVVQDEVQIRDREKPKEGGNSIHDETQTGEDKLENDKQTGGKYNTKDLMAYRNLLINNYVYDSGLYDEYPFTDYDLMNLELFKKYNIFLMEIYNHYDYLPQIYEIEKEVYDNVWTIETEWNLPKTTYQLENGKVKLRFSYLIDLWYRRLYSPDSVMKPLSEDDIENFDTREKYFQKNKMQKFTYELVSILLKQSVDILFDVIDQVYTKKIPPSPKDSDPRFDMIVWMMTNDPAMLLYHPSRKPEWSVYEKMIIDNVMDSDIISNPDKRILYEGGSTLVGVNKPRYPLESIIAELVVRSSQKYKQNRPFNPMQQNLKVMQGRINKPIPIIKQAILKKRRETRKYQENQDNQENQENQENQVYQKDQGNLQARPKDQALKTLQVIHENLRARDVETVFNEYITLDEYATIKSVFQRNDKYLLRTNLGILAFLDAKTGSLREDYGNLYKPEQKLDTHQVKSNEKHFFMELLSKQMGGSLFNSSNRFSLADYHKKYYAKYYDLYYK